MKQTRLLCDVCGQECELMKTDCDIQVIFETEQNEGRSCMPHLSLEKIDICDKCLTKVVKGNYIFASGAQGYNKYYFKEN